MDDGNDPMEVVVDDAKPLLKETEDPKRNTSEDVPDEVLLRILIQLSWRQVGRIGRVNRRWLRVSQDNGIWLSVVCRLLETKRRVDVEVMQHWYSPLGIPDSRNFEWDIYLGRVVENMFRWLNYSTKHLIVSLDERKPPQAPADTNGSATATATVPNPGVPARLVPWRRQPRDHSIGRIEAFGMATIDDAGNIGTCISSRDVSMDREWFATGTSQSVAFAKLLQEAVGALISPLTKPINSRSHPKDCDPLTLVIGQDESQSHYVLHMPMRRYLYDINHIWRNFVKLCWMEATRQREASHAIHDLSAYHNIKLRNLQRHELAHGRLSVLKQPAGSLDNFPSIIEFPSESAVNNYELHHPGGALSCSSCKRVVSIGQSEPFLNNVASALMPFDGQQVVFCSSHCFMKGSSMFRDNMLMCSNPACRSSIPLPRALGSHIRPSEDTIHLKHWMDTTGITAFDSDALKPFNDEIKNDMTEEMSQLYTKGYHWWTLANHYRFSFQHTMPRVWPMQTILTEAGQRFTYPPHHVAVPVFPNQSIVTEPFLHSNYYLKRLPTTDQATRVDGYLSTSTEVWEDRLTRYQLFKTKLAHTLLASELFKESSPTAPSQQPSSSGNDIKRSAVVSAADIDIHRGYGIPFGTIGLGLPAVRAFFDIPFLKLNSQVESVEHVDHLEGRKLVQILNALKLKPYCTGSCMRGSNCTTRCLNRNCRSVFDLEMAALSLECYELKLIIVDPDDPTNTRESSKGYVCDEYCAQAYFTQQSNQTRPTTNTHKRRRVAHDE